MSTSGSEGDPTLDGRAGAMAASLRRAVLGAGLARDASDVVLRAHALAMAPRLAALSDDHHPAYLHPGRTVMVLIRDVGPLSGPALAVAALSESEDTGLRVSPAVVAERLGQDVAYILRSVPAADREDRVAGLIALPEDVLLAVLAERLDQVRHLHLRDDLEAVWAERHEEVRSVWLPLAERTGTKLAVRFAHWARIFAKRL